MEEVIVLVEAAVILVVATATTAEAATAFVKAAMILMEAAVISVKVAATGRAELVANHFPVSCKLKEAFHYDVTIALTRRIDPEPQTALEPGEAPEQLPGPPPSPPCPAKPLTSELSRRVIAALAEQENWPKVWAFDGRKNIYAAELFLPQHEISFEVKAKDADTGRQRHFNVVVKWAQTINICTLLAFVRGEEGTNLPQDALQVLDVALKHSVSYRDEVKTFARAIFWHDPTKVWLGYQQSLRPSQGGLTLNMDMAATAFLEPRPVIDFLLRAVGLRSPQDFARLTPQQHRAASKAITGIKVEVRVGRPYVRKYKAKGLMPHGPVELTFFNEAENREMTVAQHYEQQYKMGVKYPEVPCINVGSPIKPVWLPPEVCWIAAGQRRLKLDEKQTAEMIKTATQRPQERKEYLQKCIRDFADLPNDPVVQAFKMSVDPSFMKVTGRQLPPPELQYSNCKIKPEPDRGSWDMRNTGFYKPGVISSFAIAAFCSRRNAGGPIGDPVSLQNFMWDLLSGCHKAGIQVPDVSPVPDDIIAWHNSAAAFPGDTMMSAFNAAKTYFNKEPDILFVVLPERGATEVYKAVKRASDSHLGMPSQCFNPQKGGIGTPPRRGRDQYMGNVAQKVNAKLGGINVSLISRPIPWMDEPLMVLGVDVSHPVSFNQSSPSVAAVVGSLNNSLCTYGAEIMLQGARVEIIMDLKSKVQTLMLLYYRRTGVKPKRIIAYRDGVSEGQYPQVQRHEIPQIVEAICELDKTEPNDCRIPITYVVMSKGHHTRLFPATPRDGDRNGNVFPGTVVDKGVVHPTEYDFYLNAHASIQGTSRPVHYHVLLDQNSLGPDQLQAFTYDLCYLFCRCTHSVSVAEFAEAHANLGHRMYYV
ncbi:hypothetical protein WJX75_004310 [Coccomyxa subellipsoidea]|uniref:Piwi-domain-containing protein n=1 Tax=Coccomyxa subellipsoidea TaxID=248742 RepID=A0ABR2YTC1_9CHLO